MAKVTALPLCPSPAPLPSCPGVRRLTVDGRDGIWVPASSFAVLLTAVAAGVTGQPAGPGSRAVA